MFYIRYYPDRNILRLEEIRQLAYCYWEQDGRPNGRDLEFWLKAEKYWDSLPYMVGLDIPLLDT